MSARWRLSLGQLFGVTMTVLAALLALLLVLYWSTSRKALLSSAEHLREVMASRIANRVETHLSHASNTLNDIDSFVLLRTVDPSDLDKMEAELFELLLEHPELSEIAYTYCRRSGFEANGAAVIEKAGRGQLLLFRERKSAGVNQGAAPISTRRTEFVDGRFVIRERHRPINGALWSGKVESVEQADVPDPTEHPTVRTPARSDLDGEAIWSDLHWLPEDDKLSPDERRVELTIQRSMFGADGEFCGVLKVGLFAEEIDRLVRSATDGMTGADDAHLVFLSDSAGRRVTRLNSTELLEQSDGDLRVASGAAPPVMQAALADLKHHTFDSHSPTMTSRIDVNGEICLATFKRIAGSQDWVVGIVVPERHYFGELEASRRTLLATSLAIIACILLGGAWTVRLVRRSFAQIEMQTEQMRRFDFTPAPTESHIAEVAEVLASIESAKTALRAMGKYVPIDLVRQLFERNSEPTLGGEEVEISMMFTDIEDFTTYSEQLSPDRLAKMLGQYLQAMTEAVHRSGGVVDKFIGDAVMALWNVPSRVENHSIAACEAALWCVEATEALYRSAEWGDLPRLVTRFGLHRGEVTVGHFGAPSRMNYTAIGDDVNSAARLEGLNKQYFTRIIASQSIVDNAGDRFLFRRLDRVAVKGKTLGIDIFELIGRAGAIPGPSTNIKRYESALAAYWERRFADALETLAAIENDAPSRVLEKRCRQYLHSPPAEDWGGIYSHTSK